MPTLVDSPRLRLLTLCALYTAQGIPYGFVTVTLVAFLSERGVTLDEVGGLVTFAMLPWTFKFIWGPIIDRFGVPSLGRRRPWILLAQGMMALTILSMVVVEDLTTSLVAVGWMVFAHNVFNSLQDVAVDALAVDLLADDERGRANGFMWASKFVGIAIGGAGMASVMAALGLRPALLLQVVVLVGIMMLPLWIRERPGERLWPWSSGGEVAPAPEPTESQTRALLRNLLRAFYLRSPLVAAAFAVVALLVPNLAGTLLTVMCTQELGWTTEEVSQLIGGWAVGLSVGGALLGGALADRFGAIRVIAVGVVLQGISLLAFGLVDAHWSDPSVIYGFVLVAAAIGSMVQVGLFSLYMAVSWPVVAATQFTAYMTLLNVGMTVGPKLAGPLQGALGYPGALIAIGVFHAATIALLAFIDPGQTRRVLGDGAAAPPSWPGAQPDAVSGEAP